MEYYLIHLYGCIEPHEIGPFGTEEERDKAAFNLHNGSDDFDPEEDAVIWADVDQRGKLTVGAYSAAFFEQEEL